MSRAVTEVHDMDQSVDGVHGGGAQGPGVPGRGVQGGASGKCSDGRGEDDGRLVDALVTSSFVITAALSTVAAAHHLSLTQVRVLGILQDRRLRMTELAGYLGVERSTLSGLVDRAQRSGLLERSRGTRDGRCVEVTTTAAGRELAQAVRADAAERLAPQLAALGEQDGADLARLLESMLAGAGRPSVV